jgi:hypothetical protein
MVPGGGFSRPVSLLPEFWNTKQCDSITAAWSTLLHIPVGQPDCISCSGRPMASTIHETMTLLLPTAVCPGTQRHMLGHNTPQGQAKSQTEAVTTCWFNFFYPTMYVDGQSAYYSSFATSVLVTEMVCY